MSVLVSPELNTTQQRLPYEIEQQLGLVASSDVRVDLSRAGEFISQVAEDGYGGKRGCALASQLNAHIAMGELDQATALDAQYELCTNPEYDHIWSPPMFGPDREWRAWPSVPGPLVRVLRDEYGLDVSMPRPLHARRYDLRAETEKHIRQGGVAYITGVSAVARHARIAFEPAHSSPGQLFVHDPRYAETTGLYDYDALNRFQIGAHAILY
jgi:hypothetical protein